VSFEKTVLEFCANFLQFFLRSHESDPLTLSSGEKS